MRHRLYIKYKCLKIRKVLMVMVHINKLENYFTYKTRFLEWKIEVTIS